MNINKNCPTIVPSRACAADEFRASQSVMGRNANSEISARGLNGKLQSFLSSSQIFNDDKMAAVSLRLHSQKLFENVSCFSKKKFQELWY